MIDNNYEGVPAIIPINEVLGPRSEEREQRLRALIDHWEQQGLFPTLFADAEQNGSGKNYVQLRTVPFQIILEGRKIFHQAQEELAGLDSEISVANIALASDALWAGGHYGLNTIEHGVEWMGIEEVYDALLEGYHSTFELGRSISQAHDAGTDIPQVDLVRYQIELREFITELEKLYTEKLGVPMVATK